MNHFGETEVPDLSDHEDAPIEESKSDDDPNVYKERSAQKSIIRSINSQSVDYGHRAA